MTSPDDLRYLIKFVVVSSVSFLIGSIHGVLQVIPPIRAWLDSIGSPYGGPGHMIDPLAHAHINLIGGVILLAMATTYYLLPRISHRPLYSHRLLQHSFWWTVIGAAAFYVTLMVFGVWEGALLLKSSPALPEVHAVYGPLVSVSASVMGIGIWLYLINILMTVKNIYMRS